MYSFKNDYSEGAHSRILNALVETNLDQTDGYSTDYHTKKAIELLKKKIDCDRCRYSFISWWNTSESYCNSCFFKTTSSCNRS